MRFLNNKGMSLVAVMVAAGLVGGLSLVIAQLGQNSSDISKRATTANEVNEIYNRIQKYMLNSENCDMTLQRGVQVVQESGDAASVQNMIDGDSFALDALRTSDDKKIITASEKVGLSSKISVKTISFTRVGAKSATISVEFDRDSSTSKESIITKRFDLSVKFDTNGTPVKCYSQMNNAVLTSRKESCEDLGGTFNPALSPACTIDDENFCQLASKFYDANSTPSCRESMGDPKWLTYRGGNGGSRFVTSCPKGYAITKAKGRSADRIDALQFFCSEIDFKTLSPTSKGFWLRSIGGNGGSSFDNMSCTGGKVVVGFSGKSANGIDQLRLICGYYSGSFLSQSLTRGGNGGVPFTDRCNPGTVIRKVVVMAANELDGIQGFCM